MRQPGQHAVPETDDLYPFSIQLGIDDKWTISNLRTGGTTGFKFDTYAAAEIVAKSYKENDLDGGA